jgi:hypothetical protein
MKRFALICTTAALIVAAPIAGHADAPAASMVFFFQGVPDRRLDLCIDGTEVATAVEFGSQEHTVTLPASSTSHRYKLREPARGACDGTLVDEGSFYAFGGDWVIVMAHQGRDGTARSEPLWLPARPQVRRGQTRFVIGNYAAVPGLRMTVDGERIDHLMLRSGGPTYLFKGYAAGKHIFTLRTKDRRRVLRQTLTMPEGVEFLLVLYGDRSTGYGLRAFSRTVGIR